jgi:hypothetical protein
VKYPDPMGNDGQGVNVVGRQGIVTEVRWDPVWITCPSTTIVELGLLNYPGVGFGGIR